MNLNGKKYIEQFLTGLQAGQVTNDAAVKHGVTIRETQVADGDLYWRVIGVHHLKSEEGEGANSVLVEALDEQGDRIRQGKVWAASEFDGQDTPDVRALDKGDLDPMGCDFPMFKEATYTVWMEGARRDAHEPSDRVERLHTRHPDEGHGATIGHHSYFVVFQRSRKGPTTLDEAAMIAMGRRLRDEAINAEGHFTDYAREHTFGAPITAEFTAGGYRARGYEGGIVFAPIAHPDEIAHGAW